ncbi:MAG: response regulator transcription factor [Pseudomonadota bacterium]
MGTTQRVIIVDDHPLFRDALDSSLTSAFGNVTTMQCGSLAELVELLKSESEVDLILLDLNMPGVQGFSGLLFLRAQYPSIPVLIVSATGDAATISRALNFGASGFVPKSRPIEEIRSAVQAIMDGEIWVPPDIDLSSAQSSEEERLVERLSSLTPQQVRVLVMLGDGLLNKQIAFELGVSEATIKAHVSAILQKLNVDSRTQAVIAINKLSTSEQWSPDAGQPTP